MSLSDNIDARLRSATSAEFGVVVIGRNEGDRLKRCLRSLCFDRVPVVYVDSGSSDGSAEWAQDFGAEVVALDMVLPFTAARARNAGFRRLDELWPTLLYIQFVDGDCEVAPGWFGEAVRLLQQRLDVAVVCGRLRERFPQHSLYNRLADMEWDRPTGETDACGGIAMYRTDVFRAVAGFKDDLIAGEEPELCLRIRARGGRIWRIESEMAWHDSAMTRFGQWWQRAVRGGHALAEGFALHPVASPPGEGRRMRRALGWGVGLPAVAILLAASLHPAWLALLIAYPVRALRLAAKAGPALSSQDLAWAWAISMVLSSFAESFGIGKFWWNRLRQQRQKLIEYK